MLIATRRTDLSTWRRFVEDSDAEILAATSHEEAPNKGNA